MERLPRYIIEGSKDGLIDDLNEALQAMKPLDIINGPLMTGMDEVGRLFNANQLIVAEVLQSAEAMKASVAHSGTFHGKPKKVPREAKSFSRPSKATCTISERIWSKLFWPTTVLKSSTSASRFPPNS